MQVRDSRTAPSIVVSSIPAPKASTFDGNDGGIGDVNDAENGANVEGAQVGESKQRKTRRRRKQKKSDPHTRVAPCPEDEHTRISRPRLYLVSAVVATGLLAWPCAVLFLAERTIPELPWVLAGIFPLALVLLGLL